MGPLEQIDDPRQLAFRSRRLGAFANGIRTGGLGRVRIRLGLRRFPRRDCLFRSVFDGDGFQPGRC
jgi:hypothetical protein